MGSKLIQKTLPSFEVVKCVRVEDARLWGSYSERRKEVRSKGTTQKSDLKPETSTLLEFSATTTLDTTVNEAWLFHGTSEEAAHTIATTDFRLPSAEGHFGKGLYFAERASKSLPYCKPNGEGYRVMLLCRVVLGSVLEITGTDPKGEMRVIGTEYDSLLGATDAREFVVYDIRQVYPEYIMYFNGDWSKAGKDETPEQALLRQVMDMGFDEATALNALKATKYQSVEEAVQKILG